jgi:hypothetical protein
LWVGPIWFGFRALFRYDVDWPYTFALVKKVMPGSLDPLLTRQLVDVDRHAHEGSAAKEQI